MSGAKRKPMGRPRKYMETRSNLTVGLTTSMRNALKEHAYANGRSMSEEVSLRLIASFDQPALVDALADRLEERLSQTRAKPVRAHSYQFAWPIFSKG